MKSIFLFVLACICVISGIYSTSFLPAETSQLIDNKYESWSGVIRIWAAEGTGCTGWLNLAASDTEKQHNGVYIHIQEVSLTAISEYLTTGINPPDMIVYPYSITPDTSGLVPVTSVYPLRSSITHSPYAIPILLQAKFWIYNPSVITTLPSDMYDTPAACREDDLNSLIALSTGLRPSEGITQQTPGADLGLDGETNTPVLPSGNISCRASSDLIICDSPRAKFVEGTVPVFIGGIRDILRLSDHQDAAAAVTGEYVYTTEALMISIVDKHDPRTNICLQYIDELMTDGQVSAARAQAFPAVTGVSAWTHNAILAPAEASLEGRTWLLAADGSSDASQQYIEGKLTADAAMERIINESSH